MLGFPLRNDSRVFRRVSSGVTAGLCLVMISSHHGWAQQEIDFVIDADGFMADKKPATRNLPVGGKQLSGTRGAEILLSCNKKPLLYVCTGANCSVTACALEPGKRVGDVEAKEWSFTPPKREGLAGYMRREPKPAPIAAARDVGGPVDAVVLQDEKGVHWAPALAGVFEGNYCLLVGTLPPSAQTWTTTLQWDRRREPEGLAAVTGLPPGLYSLRKGPAGASSCQPDADADAAWVLVAAGGEFAPISAEWRSYAESIEELERSGVSPSLTATLRRASLAALAEQ